MRKRIHRGHGAEASTGGRLGVERVGRLILKSVFRSWSWIGIESKRGKLRVKSRIGVAAEQRQRRVHD